MQFDVIPDLRGPGTCLTAIGQDELKSQPCDPADENQKWELQSYASFQAALAAARGGKA